MAFQSTFEALYPGWSKNDCFSPTDYTTTTASLPDAVKYAPDYKSGSAFIEVKDSVFYNYTEWLYHSGLENLSVYTPDGLFPFHSLLYSGPFSGSKHGSGLPYMRIEKSPIFQEVLKEGVTLKEMILKRVKELLPNSL